MDSKGAAFGGVEGQSPSPSGWGELLRGANAVRSAVVGGGMILHAINVFIVTTILPTVVRDIGGLRFFAWNTTLYMIASLLAGSVCTRLLRRVGPRWSYRIALSCFGLGCLVCALAPTMPMLLVGRCVQGFGAGTLSALSFILIRLLFAEHLWSRALAIVSAMWGIATLLGPAVGGVFAQYSAWRAAFWSLCIITPAFAALVELTLPRGMPRIGAQFTAMEFVNLAVLVGSVLAVSAGSMAAEPLWNALGLAVAVAGLLGFARLEARRGVRLLPLGACNPATALGATYAAQTMLLIAVTTEIFVPYFLQTLHFLTPLYAGYLTALMSAGWTTGAVIASGARPALARALMMWGPVALAISLGGMAVLTPPATTAVFPLVVIGFLLLGMGLGIGICWPHLGTRVFTFAPEGEKELAASSITIIVMVSQAFGSALGGLVTNVAGMTSPGGMTGAASAAAWLFGTYATAPVFSVLAIRRLLALRPAVA
jgi:MFS family permease